MTNSTEQASTNSRSNHPSTFELVVPVEAMFTSPMSGGTMTFDLLRTAPASLALYNDLFDVIDEQHLGENFKTFFTLKFAVPEDPEKVMVLTDAAGHSATGELTFRSTLPIGSSNGQMFLALTFGDTVCTLVLDCPISEVGF